MSARVLKTRVRRASWKKAKSPFYIRVFSAINASDLGLKAKMTMLWLQVDVRTNRSVTPKSPLVIN